MQSAFHYRVTVMDANYREQIKAHHANFEVALVRQSEEIHKRLWEDLARIRTEYESVIHAELRLARQKASLASTTDPATGQAAGNVPPPEFETIDWLKFAEKFRGSEEAIRQRQQMYARSLPRARPSVWISAAGAARCWRFFARRASRLGDRSE